MLNRNDILETINMIDQQHLDIRTITMGISLLSCADPDPKAACRKIYDKITRCAEKLVRTGEEIEREFGIPIVNKRISVTPMALVAAASETEDYVPFAAALWSNDIPEIEAFMRGNCGLCFKTVAQFRDYLFSGKEA